MPATEELSVHHCYDDILSRIAEEPVWFDEHGVPRYCEFAPSKVANPYAEEAALVEVTCQSCSRPFRVAFSARASAAVSQEDWPAGPIGKAIREKTLDYGDPPNVWCCHAGPSMTSVPRRVLEYWRQGNPGLVRMEGHRRVITNPKAYFTWTRYPSFEIEVWVDP